MSEPTPQDVAAAFERQAFPPLPPMAQGVSGNVICAVCWIDYIDRDDDSWRYTPIHVVTLYKGAAVCEKHLRERLEADRG